MKKNAFFILLGIAFLFLPLRISTFWRGKVPCGPFGDEKSYLGLALKIENEGIDGYNLRGLEYRTDGDFFVLQSADSSSNLLRDRSGTDFGITDEALFHAPPLFAYLLSASHRLFTGEDTYRIKLFQEGPDTFSLPVVGAQLYAALPSFLFSIVTLLSVYFLAKTIHSVACGVLAACFFAVSPVDIMVTHQVWADGLVAACLSVSFLLFWCALLKRSFVYLFISGIVCGLGLLSKNNTLLVFAVMILFYSCRSTKAMESLKDSPLLTIRGLGVFMAAAFFLALPWYLKMLSHYGVIAYNPYVRGISNLHAFFLWINARPFYTYLVNIPWQHPVFLFGYGYIVAWFFKKEKDTGTVLMTCWFGVFLLLLTIFVYIDEMTGPDSRYMLPALPPLCILSAQGVLEVLKRIREHKAFVPLVTALWISVVFSFWWSLSIGYSATVRYAHYLAIPF